MDSSNNKASSEVSLEVKEEQIDIDQVLMPTNCDYFIIQYDDSKKKVAKPQQKLRPFSARYPGFQFESSDYSSPEELRQALDDSLTKIPEAGFQCNFCGRMFEKKNHIFDHVEIHFAKKKTHYYVCKNCGKYVSTESGIRHHKAKKTKECLTLNGYKYKKL